MPIDDLSNPEGPEPQSEPPVPRASLVDNRFDWWHGLAAVGLFLLAGLTAGVALALGAPGAGLLGVLAATAVGDWAVVAFVAALAWRLYGSVRTGLAIRFGLPPRVYVWGTLAVLGVFLASLVYDLALRAFGVRFEQRLVQAASEMRGPWHWVGLLILGGLVIPVAEEVVFRGCLYPALRRRMTAGRAMTYSALVFAAIHMEPGALAPIFLMGVILAWFRERTGSLVAPIYVHALNNLTSLTLVMLSQQPLGR